MSASENVDASEGEEAQIELIDFEEKLIVETLTDDVLFVVARGLCLERLIIHHLKLFSDPQLLLLVINTSTQDEIFYIEQLKRAKVKCQPKLITADISTKDRQALYLEGGVQFVTSRILVVDLLTDRIPVNQVAGIIVCRAHQLLSSYQESFILRLYREKKPNGFVKAFTDFATAITSSGLGQLQRLVARLYVRKVELVPRFEASVKECLNQRAPELIEMTVEMSAGMRKIQSSLVDIIRTCLKELKQCTSSVDVETEDDATSSAAALYESKLERDLEPVMATLTDKQQRLLEDLKQLRHLLKEAEQLDPVTLYHSFTSLQSSKEVFASNSGWLFTPTASKIYEEIEKQCKPPSGPKSKQSKQGWNIQEPPKWSALKAVLNEIREAAAEMKANSSEAVEGADASETAVLLIGAGEPVCRQLCDLIKLGPERLKWMLRRHAFEAIPTAGKEQEPECDPWWDPNSVTLYGNNGEQNAETRAEMLANVKMAQRNALRQGRKRRQQAAKKAPTTKRKTVASAPDPKQTKLLRFGIGAQRQNEQQQQTSKVEAPAVVELSGSSDEDDASEEPTTSAADTEGKEDEEVVVSRPPDPPLSVRPQGERYNLLRHLDCSKPTFVILYHVELATLRMLEMYKAANPDRPLRIYVFMYRESTEEERYLTALRREQDSFENLIREQGTLLIPREYDTARDAPSRFEAPVSTRRAGGRRSNEEQQAEDTRPQVIVDVREFNSELPSVVYKRGIDIVPVTLEVGDYVLAGDVCVERKALDDLVGSLQNGRVFKQAEQMLRHYSNSVLLVEASGRTNGSSKRRIGVGGGPFQGEMSKRCREIRSLLTVLVRYQPNLRIVWSTEPQATVELFEEIKFGKEEPNVEKAVAVRSDELGEEGSSLDDEDSGGTVSGRINPAARQMVTHIPTLASGDVDRVLRSASSLLWLCRADFNQLTDCCGGNHLQADALRTFFNTDFRAAGGW